MQIIVVIVYALFLSTLSLRRATHYDNYNLHCTEISIHALLAESDHLPHGPTSRHSISIHALLAESDHVSVECVEVSKISIHALLAESDLAPEQNTTQQTNFYPRSPCGERRMWATAMPCGMRFLSTLSLRRATPAEHHANSQQEFLSTLSLRRATAAGRFLLS